MVKIYTNKNFLNETYRKQIFPLLLDLHFLKDKNLLDYFVFVESISDCNIVVMPIDYLQFLNHEKEFNELVSLAKSHQKPIWIYTAGDYGFTNYILNAFTFRLGGFDSKLNKNTYILPSFIVDPYSGQIKKDFMPIKKEEKPSIGFVGHAQSGIFKFSKEYINHLKYSVKRRLKIQMADKQSFYPSSVKRAQHLKELSTNKLFKTDFVLRTQYRAGAKSKEERKKSTQEFYENIYNNGYTFCLRGVGNFSVRFYETLAVGRIPILLNTDCRLPLNDKIDWKKHCVIVDEKTSLEEQILRFHNALTGEQFENLQRSNRNLWLNYLRRDSYFKSIYKQFI